MENHKEPPRETLSRREFTRLGRDVIIAAGGTALGGLLIGGAAYKGKQRNEQQIAEQEREIYEKDKFINEQLFGEGHPAYNELVMSSYLWDGFSEAVLDQSDVIYTVAEHYNLPPNVIATIIQVESSGNPDAVSPAGAIGLFQVMPMHFENAGIPKSEWFNPMVNGIMGGQVYYEMLNKVRTLEGFSEDEIPFRDPRIYIKGLAEYNAGSYADGGFETMPEETQNYLMRIVRLWDELVKINQ